MLNEWLPGQLDNDPDLTLAEPCEAFEEARDPWRWLASRFDARRRVFIDESGFHTSLTRLRARAPRGKRAYGKVPRNRGKNQTLIASITLEGGMGAALSIKGSTDAELFEAYVEEFLAPTLEAGQVVVLDGLGGLGTDRVRELVEGRGADLLFPPSYSPDLNPMEEAFSKTKNIVRKAGARTREALDEAMGATLSAVTLQDKGADWVRKVLGWSAQIVKRPRRWVRVPEGREPPPYPKGFIVVPPRRWVVERSFSWTGQNRRLSKDYERVPETVEAFMYVVMSRLMVRRLAHS